MTTKQKTKKGEKMTAKKEVKKGMSGVKMAAVGAGLAAVGAGAYYLMGPKGKANQKKAKALMSKIEKEVKSKIKDAKTVAKPVYNKSIDSLAETYSKQYKMHEGDIKALAKKLKGEWQSASGTAKKSIRKTIKKAIK